jgi:hypothetical protein
VPAPVKSPIVKSGIFGAESGVFGKGALAALGATLLTTGLGFVISGVAAQRSALLAGGCVVGFLTLQWIGLDGMRRGTRRGIITMGVTMVLRMGGLGVALWFFTVNGVVVTTTERLWSFIAGGAAIVAWLLALLSNRESPKAIRALSGYTPRPDWEELV